MIISESSDFHPVSLGNEEEAAPATTDEVPKIS